MPDKLLEQKTAALIDFKKSLPRNNAELAELVHKVFWIGMQAGIEIGQKETNHIMCNFGKD